MEQGVNYKSVMQAVGGAALLVSVVGGLALVGPLARQLTPSAPVSGCAAGQTPELREGFAKLGAALGPEVVGGPVECEHPVDGQGDTEQATTTGVLRYQARSNTPSFLGGGHVWSLESRGLVLDGQVVDSPGPPR
jgi:hypothetical protein